ncbi:MAG: trypsin-like peptidase domain-containing protein [Thermogemmata sp.]|nr:trypsin-like peptidase domain-containing protein [Thermogemmata sp.]
MQQRWAVSKWALVAVGAVVAAKLATAEGITTPFRTTDEHTVGATIAADHDQKEKLPVGACVWVRTRESGGTGLIVDAKKRWALTARHIVGDHRQVEVVFPVRIGSQWQSERQWYLHQRSLLQESRHWTTARVLRVSDGHDLALLELAALPADVPPVRWSKRPPVLGETVNLIGQRGDLPTLWNRSQGVLRAFASRGEGYYAAGRKVAAETPLLLAQLPIEEGDSGGPVFDQHGQCVGLAVAVRRSAAPAALLITATDAQAFLKSSVPAGGEPENPGVTPIVQTLLRATVWIHPPSADRPLAGVLIDPRHVLTVTIPAIRLGDAVGMAVPLRSAAGYRQERQWYLDPLHLYQHGCWRFARVVAIDPERQLCLIRLASPWPGMQPLALAATPPAVGQTIHAMNHPTGVELAFVYAQGIIRQQGAMPGFGDQKPLRILLAQLPAVAACPGGPVINDRGELTGLWLEREGPAQAAYVLSIEEIRTFLNVCAVDGQPPHSVEAAIARLSQYGQRLRRAIAYGLVCRAVVRLRQHNAAAATADLQQALRWYPASSAAQRLRLPLLAPHDRLAALNAAIEYGPFDPELLRCRARWAIKQNDWRLARSDLQRLLIVHPEDGAARQQLVEVLLELGDTDKAAQAVRDVLRAEPSRRCNLATDLLRQAERLVTRYPLQPQIARDWLLTAMGKSGHPPWEQAARQAASLTQPQQQLDYLLAYLRKEGNKP